MIFDTLYDENNGWAPLKLRCSEVARTPDWILDLQTAPKSPGNAGFPRAAGMVRWAKTGLVGVTMDAGGGGVEVWFS